MHSWKISKDTRLKITEAWSQFSIQSWQKLSPFVLKKTHFLFVWAFFFQYPKLKVPKSNWRHHPKNQYGIIFTSLKSCVHRIAFNIFIWFPFNSKISYSESRLIVLCFLITFALLALPSTHRCCWDLPILAARKKQQAFHSLNFSIIQLANLLHN